MAVYAIGDVQGCCDPLEALLERIGFSPDRDTLWFVGDLVNRGPRSADVVRLVKDLGAAAVTVLGNHDLSLLAVAEGFVQPKRRDTYDDVLNAPDAAELLDWLRHQPLVRHDEHLGCTLVHAGLHKSWSVDDALRLSGEVQGVLQRADYRTFLEVMFGHDPDQWDEGLTGHDRIRAIVNVCTRMRFCHPDGRLDFGCKEGLDAAPPGLAPWFALPGRRSIDTTVVFGHWASLGYRKEPGILALDSGCVWGATLTAQRLDADTPPVSIACGGHP